MKQWISAIIIFVQAVSVTGSLAWAQAGLPRNCQQIFEILNEPGEQHPTLSSSRPLNSLHPSEKSKFFHRLRTDALDYIRNQCLETGGVLTCFASKNHDMSEQLWVRDNMIVLSTLTDRLEFILKDDPMLKTELRRVKGTEPRSAEIKSTLEQRLFEKKTILRDVKSTLLFWKKFHETLVPARDHGDLIWHNGYLLTLFNPGEPIATLRGQMVKKPWGSPQVDGPGYEGIAASKFFQLLLKYATYDGKGDPEFLALWPTEKDRDTFLSALYKKELRTDTPLQGSLSKTAAEYLLHQALEARFDSSGQLISIRFPKSKDLWEWTGLTPDVAHFHTNAIIYSGLKAVATLAQLQKDPLAAKAYDQVAELLRTQTLDHFWNRKKKILMAHVNPDLVPSKPDGFDLGVMEGILGAEGGFISLTDDRVFSTIFQSEKAFHQAMEINHDLQLKDGIYIPRYPNDDYDGFDIGPGHLGNPWVIGNFRWADYYYRVAKQLRNTPITFTDLNLAFFSEGLGLPESRSETVVPRNPGHQAILHALERKGDLLIQKVLESFENPEFEQPPLPEQKKNIFYFLGEQIHRSTGENTGSQGLTWNAAAALRAGQSWQELQKAKN